MGLSFPAVSPNIFRTGFQHRQTEDIFRTGWRGMQASWPTSPSHNTTGQRNHRDLKRPRSSNLRARSSTDGELRTVSPTACRRRTACRPWRKGRLVRRRHRTQNQTGVDGGTTGCCFSRNRLLSVASGNHRNNNNNNNKPYAGTEKIEVQLTCLNRQTCAYFCIFQISSEGSGTYCCPGLVSIPAWLQWAQFSKILLPLIY